MTLTHGRWIDVYAGLSSPVVVVEQQGEGPAIPRRGVREVRDPQRYNESFGGTRARWVANVSSTGVHAGPVLLVSLDISDTYETCAQHLLRLY